MVGQLHSWLQLNYPKARGLLYRSWCMRDQLCTKGKSNLVTLVLFLPFKMSWCPFYWNVFRTVNLNQFVDWYLIDKGRIPTANNRVRISPSDCLFHIFHWNEGNSINCYSFSLPSCLAGALSVEQSRYEGPPRKEPTWLRYYDCGGYFIFGRPMYTKHVCCRHKQSNV